MMQPMVGTNPGSAVRLVNFRIPDNQITEGKPVAKIWINAQSSDLKITQGVWDCTAGEFTWDYTWDEFMMILEGEARITPKVGSSFTLHAGDFAHFPPGVQVKFQVPRYIKKTFVIRTPDPLKL